MELNFKIIMPAMPDTLHYEKKAGLKQDGIQFGNNSISIKDLTFEQANQFAEEWKEEFIRHWKQKQR